QAAAGLLSFLGAPAQQATLVQAGYRDASGKVVPSPAGAGTLADQPRVVIKPPSGGVLAKVQASWWTVRKPARVLVIVDTSGSMADVVQGSNTKLDLAKAALLAAIGQVGDDDELGLWSFSDQHHELVPLGRVGIQRDKLKAAIAGLRANGGTLLYQSVLDGWNYVRQTADPLHISAVVVLTDGQDNGSPDGELNKLTSSLSGQPAAGSVRVFTVAYGHDADKADLLEIATAARGEAYDASDPTLIREVFLAVLSNF
ncbi:MAG TPA: VWA domain-containing protein, partial [bacterium]|nr:VWA domain-containing protein [bacterium]